MPVPTWLPTLDADFPRERIALGDGAAVAVRRCGTQGAPVAVLLHGIGSAGASWLPCARALASTHRVIAWDMPGYGESTPLADADPRAEAYAQRLEGLLQALDVRSCLLVGHSLGAIVAAASAHRQPQRLRALVLLSPAGGYGAPGLEADRARVRTERLQTLDRLGVAGLAATRGPTLVQPGAPEAAREWAQWNMAQLNEAGYRQAVELLCGDDLRRHAPVAVPVHLHVGDADTVTPPARVRAIASSFGVAPEAVGLIAGAGHLCAIEQPEAVAQMLRAADAMASEAMR